MLCPSSCAMYTLLPAGQGGGMTAAAASSRQAEPSCTYASTHDSRVKHINTLPQHCLPAQRPPTVPACFCFTRLKADSFHSPQYQNLSTPKASEGTTPHPTRRRSPGNIHNRMTAVVQSSTLQCTLYLYPSLSLPPHPPRVIFMKGRGRMSGTRGGSLSLYVAVGTLRPVRTPGSAARLQLL